MRVAAAPSPLPGGAEVALPARAGAAAAPSPARAGAAPSPARARAAPSPARAGGGAGGCGGRVVGGAAVAAAAVAGAGAPGVGGAPVATPLGSPLQCRRPPGGGARAAAGAPPSERSGRRRSGSGGRAVSAAAAAGRSWLLRGTPGSGGRHARRAGVFAAGAAPVRRPRARRSPCGRPLGGFRRRRGARRRGRRRGRCRRRGRRPPQRPCAGAGAPALAGGRAAAVAPTAPGAAKQQWQAAAGGTGRVARQRGREPGLAERRAGAVTGAPASARRVGGLPRA